MIEIIQWPPVHYCTYSLHGRLFEQQPDEPFITTMQDGTVDTDLKRQTPGWINRIQRFGMQNNIPKKEWDEQSIYYSLVPKLPPALRSKYFREARSTFLTPNQLMSAVPHSAPVPAGLAQAAGLVGVADSDSDLPVRLATLNADKWLATLKKWVAADPANRKSKTVAGPPWWYAAHSLALNPDRTTTPQRFIGVWLGSFPCRLCRIGGRIYIARHPVPGWEGFAQWVNDIHQYVTERKTR